MRGNRTRPARTASSVRAGVTGAGGTPRARAFAARWSRTTNVSPAIGSGIGAGSTSA